MRRVYFTTALLTVAGTIFFASRYGARYALAFFLGAAGSFGNLLLFDWLSKAISPTGEGQRKKPWPARLFIGRYLGMFAVGYATVKALDVNPLPVLLGFLVSTAAVLASSIADLIRSFSNR